MTSRRHRFIDAALRYQQLLDAGQVINLEEFVMQEPADLRADLLSYLRTTFALGDLSEAVVLTSEEQAQAERAVGQARNQFALGQATATSHKQQNLTALRTAQSLSLGRLAQRINLPIPVLDRIERGGVVLATLPDQLVARLAGALQIAEDQIRAALTASQSAGTRPSSPAYLSAKDGTVEQREAVISFADALAASKPTPAQRADWQE